MDKMKVKENEFNFNRKQDDEIMIHLLNKRINYFSEVLIKYLKMRKFTLNDETAELNNMISSLESIRI